MSLVVAIRHDFGGFTINSAFETAGGVTALFGRSGAGKTTVVNTISGLMRPSHGCVIVDGTTLLDTDKKIFVPMHKRRVGYVFQDSRLFPHMTVHQNLEFGRWFTPRRRRYADPGRVIELLGIGHLLGRRPGRLSGGERQRVAIGRALLASPALLLLDEPLAALDDARKMEILPFIERLRDELHIPIVYVSHSVPEVARIATTVVLMSDGRVERVGPVAEVMTDPSLFPSFGRGETGAVLRGRIEGSDASEGLTVVAMSGGRVVVPLIDAPTGAAVSIHVRARDVILARSRPQDLSAQNILDAVVVEIGSSETGIVDVKLACGDDVLLARVTRRSQAALGIVPGQPVYAIVKVVAVGRGDIAVTW